MKLTLWTIALFLALACTTLFGIRLHSPVHAQNTKVTPHPDEARKAIRKVLDDQTTAWNKGDLRGFMEGYWQSPDLRFYSGKDVTSGWQATFDRYKKRYQTEGKKMGQLTFHDLDIEILGPDHALVRGRFQVVLPDEKLGGLFTLIVKKMAPGSRIVHDHTSS